ncbi:hypothetical protein MJO29_001145 [Puccinia striiformis f. sp. tritici]|nr:hypothetical protein MJO29_001145 [Puccinia striiformis f. sp. tritici]
MPTKAQNSQRQRRRDELVVKNQNRPAPKSLKKKQCTQKKTTSKTPEKNLIGSNGDLATNPILIEAYSKGTKRGDPIPIDSHGDEANDPILINPDGEDDGDGITWLQQCEMEEHNEANDAVNLINVSLSDDDSSDEELDEEEPFPSFWPVFLKTTTPTADPPATRTLKSGKIGYRKPTESSNPDSKKLIPAKVSRQTEAVWRQNRLEAVGREDNPVMTSWRKSAHQDSRSSNPPSTAVINDGEASIDQISPSPLLELLPINSGDASEIRLQGLLHTYLSARKVIKTTNFKVKAEAQWEKLRRAINIADVKYKKQAATNKLFVYPESTIANLNEFNHFRRQYQLDGTKSPSLTASLSTALSSIRRRTIHRDNQQQPSSGIYLARVISRQARYIVNNKEILKTQNGNRTNHKSLINNAEIRQVLFSWAASQVPGEVNPSTFKEYTVNTVLPRFGINQNLARSTITRWMIKLGFRPQAYRKSLYFDGHERPDVVVARKKYIEDYRRFRHCSRVYGGDNLEIAAEIDPEVLGDNRETVFIFHDESTVHAKERPRLSWLLPGTNELRSKNTGRLIHISDFILETTGRLKLSPDEFNLSQEDTGKQPESDDATTVIYPGANGDKWWDMEQLCHQVSHKAIPIFETLHPSSQAVFVFDCSSAHGAYAKDALRVQNMNLNPGGKQAILRGTTIPTDDPNIPEQLRGRPQSMVFDESHPLFAGKAKGVQAVLEERGLWTHYSQKARKAGKTSLNLRCKTCTASNVAKDLLKKSEQLIKEAEANGFSLSHDTSIKEALATHPVPPDCEIDLVQVASQTNEPLITQEACCWSKILSLQSDFATERPLLQSIIEDAGHICLFLPKFHCELNPIELFWSYIKTEYRKESHQHKSFASAKELFERVRHACPLTTIRRYFRRID